MNLRLHATLLSTSTLLGCASSSPHRVLPSDPLVVEVQRKLDSLHTAGGFPGATFGIALPDGRTIGLVTGLADTATRRAMAPTDRQFH